VSGVRSRHNKSLKADAPLRVVSRGLASSRRHPQILMSRQLLPLRGLVMNLAGEIREGRREFLPRDRAYALLCEWTGQDFGYDVARWPSWIRTHPRRVKRQTD